jgi:hypothetical protein
VLVGRAGIDARAIEIDDFETPPLMIKAFANGRQVTELIESEARSRVIVALLREGDGQPVTVRPSRIPADYAALNRANFLRRPVISLGAGAAHQHCSLTVAQTASLKEGLDGLLVVDDRLGRPA